ncbi:MAG TPA: pyruvate dehydrogenase complex dihydrolipoamide acetyltransferase [Labilithrix sp.]|nr:pyruvate dehydrogenase complex dihydrolipoamide acetyltransferase [Labilithrix sp.]
MAKILDMPKLSPTMEEGVLAIWHKKEGDSVEVDDLLAEVETDKATMEFRAFDKGTLLKQLVSEGAQVKLGQPVAILGTPGEDVSGLTAQSSANGGAAAQAAEAPQEAEEPAAETPRSPPVVETKAPPPMAPAPTRPVAPVDRGNVLTRTERDASAAAVARPSADGERILASPYVRKVARERGIELAGAHGSGEHGRIVPADLDALAKGNGRAEAALVRAAQAPLATPRLAEPESRPLSPMRKTIARRLTQAKQTVPHFYLTIDVDAEELVALRERINAELAAGITNGNNAEAPKPDKISINDMIVKASAAAIVRVPECNAQFTEEAILVHKRVDISVAVAIPDGLVTPVVRNADQKSVVAIAREVRDLASRARAKKLKPEEMSDGTFSISNLGMFGIDEFAAVINPPEGAILAVGQVRDEPVVKDGVVKPGKKLAMTLSCDHRVVDGAVGAAFLAELRELLERPMRILTG